MQPFMEQFLRFAASKPAKRRYEYPDPQVCACGQFAKSMGIYEDYESTVTEIDVSNKFFPLEKLAATAPFTWGALTERIRNHLAMAK